MSDALDTAYDFNEILTFFGIGTRMVSKFGSGLINDTFSVSTESGENSEYLLQRINHQIFKDVPALMNNIVQITSHIRKKHLGTQKPQPEVIFGAGGQNHYCDESGNYWRMFSYMQDCRSYDSLDNEKQAFEAGKAFGRFQLMLSDLDGSRIKDSIPDFHNIGKRLRDFREAIETDAVNRVSDVRPEIAFLLEREKSMSVIPELASKGLLPKRIVHGDTKFSNILFNGNDEVQCVVDLDTTMASYSAFDFGDAIRTIINTAAEDEKDLEKIHLNIPFFRAYTRGYLSEAIQFLTGEELNSLIEGALLVPYMQAVRFLADYLEGDHYYKIKSPTHNLQRARAQIELVRKLEENKAELGQIIQMEAAAPFSR